MDSERFNYIRDHLLKLNNTQLSELLAVPDTSISNWSKGKREIPDYIAKSLELHAAETLKTVRFPLSLTELFALSRLAEKNGQTIEALLVGLIRKAIAPATPFPDTRITFPSAAAAPSPPDALDDAIVSHIKRHGTLLSQTIDTIGGDTPLHRDLKPANIHLNEDTQPPAVIDYGQRQPVTYKKTRRITPKDSE